LLDVASDSLSKLFTVIPPSFIEELLSRTDVVTVVGRHVELKKAGINYKGLCPFHGEKTPSFSVSPTRQTYHCFGCGVHGNALGFLVEHLGLGFVEAVKELAQEAGLSVPQEDASPEERQAAAQVREQQNTLTQTQEKAAEHYRRQLRQSERAVAYLKGRGLTGEIAKRFGMGYAPASWNGLASVFAHYDDPLLVEAGLVILQDEQAPDGRRYDRFRDRIMFPIRNVKGETIAFGGRVLDQGEPKYLNSPETPVFVKGRELYGLFEARTALRNKGYALVTEGYMDVVALAQLGFENAVATLGTACTAEHVSKLLRFTEQVVFSFDGDAAGRRAAGRALEASLPHATDTRSFRFLFLPPEHDPDSYIRAFGPQAFEACVQDAVPLSRQLIEHASQDCDLSSAEGRAKMLAQARPLWSALPDGALSRQLLAELARLSGLPTDELSELWRQAPTSRGRGFSSAAQDAGAPTHGESTNANHFHSSPASPRRWPGKRQAPRLNLGQRPTPKKPEDRVVQMLFGEPAWWENLTPYEQDLLHALPEPHGSLVAWLERDVAEHGPRPWAVLKPALEADEQLQDDQRQLADGDADPGATPADLRRALDLLIERALKTQMDELIPRASSDPQAMQALRVLLQQQNELKQRKSGAPAEDEQAPNAG
jgi:DNA primase